MKIRFHKITWTFGPGGAYCAVYSVALRQSRGLRQEHRLLQLTLWLGHQGFTGSDLCHCLLSLILKSFLSLIGADLLLAAMAGLCYKPSYKEPLHYSLKQETVGMHDKTITWYPLYSNKPSPWMAWIFMFMGYPYLTQSPGPNPQCNLPATPILHH